MRKNIFGKGTYYDCFKNYVEADDCVAVLLTDDIDVFNGTDMLEIFKYKNIVAIVSSPIEQVKNLVKKANINGCNILVGNVLAFNDNGAYIVYCGDEKVFNRIGNSFNLKGKQQYLGKNPLLTSVISNSVNEIHYSYVLAYYVGLVLSIKYDLPLETYFTHVGKSVPMLCEGAYRNIWKTLSDANNYEDVDDVIHGMEMLVCKMKKDQTKDLIFADVQKQKQLNKILHAYWQSISLMEEENG